MSATAPAPPARIARLSLTTADPARAAAFYVEALGFERLGAEQHRSQAFAELMGIAGGASAMVLRRGGQEVALLAFDAPGRPYPAGSAADDRWFQHMAIVVADMAAAYQRLNARADWSPISIGGPQRLPASSGGVVAFKFRDPEGHPLELLELPGLGAALAGIDHSAIVIADTEPSLAVYRRGLGFAPRSMSLNRGVEQAQLDAVRDPLVEVTGLRLPKAPPPHLELLCYREPRRGRARLDLRSNDIATMRIEVACADPAAAAGALAATGCEPLSPGVVGLAGGRAATLVRDPDGHHILLIQRSR